ncbi:hypothetical protein O3P69_006015 [Scylla paramamosain]|uniref:Uncharacterized protein n=1 Tax=Scylla paramamosain TaxID=85552 RepID=A0AAW0U7Z2_SCYPA
MTRLVFLAVVAAMIVDVMAGPACQSPIPNNRLRELPLVNLPVQTLVQRVGDSQLADQVYQCYTNDGMDCTPCQSGEVSEIVALLPVLLQDCQTKNSNVCPRDLQPKAARIVQEMIKTYGNRYDAILTRL